MTRLDLGRAQAWQPSPDVLRFTTLDAHAEGEPLRVITGGLPPLPGNTILEKRRFARQQLDSLRRLLMFEPRGHADMYGAIVTEAVTADGDLGVLFLHNEGWSTMCGHGIIALTTAIFETGMLPMQDRLNIDAPAGRIVARARWQGGRVASVSFENVPSFVLALDETIDVPDLGPVRYDLAFGGAFYAYVEAGPVGVGLTASDHRPLIEKGMMIKRAIMAGREIRHPVEPDLSFLYGVIFTGPPQAPEAHARNVCIFAQGEVDRSPTGTGVSGRVAIEHARGRLKPDQPFVVESLLGTRFTGQVAGLTRFGPHEAVTPLVEGRAWITGRHEFFLTPDDPLPQGFILR